MPIIIPIASHSVRDCIIQSGVRYCESAPLNHNSVGWLLLGFLALVLWYVMWTWIAETYFDMSLGVLFGGGFGIPLLVAGIALLLL